MKRLKRDKGARVDVEFCEACGSVCDARCRADRLRDRAREKALLNGRAMS